MAKAKNDTDRHQNREEILAVALRLFVETGYDATPMSRIAEEAGVAPNTIYWYFADKDALLIAVLDMLLADGARQFQLRKTTSLDGQLLWLLGVLDGVKNLIATVHARVSLSPAIATWHQQFHRMLEAMLLAELRKHGTPDGDLAPASRVAMFVIEGLLAHPTSTKDRRALVQWLVSGLAQARSPGSL